MSDPGRPPTLGDDAVPQLLDGTHRPGLYQWPPAADPAAVGAARAAAEHARWHPAALDLATVTDKAGLLEHCARAFDFPDWAGRNWDALADCLTDLSWWPPAAGRLIIAGHWPAFRAADPAAATTAEEIFRQATDYWREQPPPMAVLLG